MQFNQQSSAVGNTSLIPNGTLAWLLVKVREFKVSSSTGSRYADLELTVVGGPYERRKVFTKIGDPEWDGNSEDYKKMGYSAVSRMIEAAGLVKHDDPNSYAKVNGAKFDQLMGMLDGKLVAAKIRVQPEKDGYPEKNEIADWLSPNPISSSFKNFQKLMQGETAPAGGLPKPPGALGAAPTAPAPTWGNAAPNPAPQPTQPVTGPGAGPATPVVGAPTAAWLQQAQQK